MTKVEMAADPSHQSDEPSSRRGSNSSMRSNRSDHTQQISGATPQLRQHGARLPPAARHSSISMFTGLTSGPGSPSSRAGGRHSALSLGSIDRVFPIRSVVSIDPTATPAPQNDTSDHFPDMSFGMEGGTAARRARTEPQSRQSRSPTGRSMSFPKDFSFPRRQSSISAVSDATNASADRKASGSTGTATGRVGVPVISKLVADSSSTISDGASSVSGGVSLGGRSESMPQDIEDGVYVTARFQHVITEGGHAVITGRNGETLQRCEDEPIHIPGAVQSFGLLIAFKEEDGKMVVRVVSENSHRIIGYTPVELFALPNFLDIFTDDQADNILDHLDFIRDDEAADVVVNGPEVFMLSIRPPGRRTQKLWCAMHINDSNRDIVICEFEIEDDQSNPLMPVGEKSPEPPEDTLGSDPTPEDYAESTVNVSKPLRVLRSARKKRGEAAAMEVFNIMSQVQEQLASAPSLQVFLRVLIGVVKELTGFHRVMIYQFDQTWNGRVVAELVDPRATKDLYKGLNFPASDIPKQAREMYKLNKVRLLYDRDQVTSRLVCRTTEDLATPLDLTHAYLRAMSPIHIKYLANMAVRSSMSISISAFNELWGLIALHSYGGKGMRVSFPIRKMCRLVGDTASRNVERLSYASRLQARKLINTSSTASNPSGYIVASSEDLLNLFDADVGALSIHDETKVMGKTHGQLQEILAMVEYLRLRQFSSVYTSQDIKTDFPDLRYAPGLKFLAGVLFVPLSTGGKDFIAFFRKGVLQEVKWAGNPYEKFIKEGTEGCLEPRKSFKTWSETIIGRCRDWSEEEIETASVLCLVYGKFIDVWRQKEAALQNSQLTKILLANSAHEVRTPLNAIINYLEIALESSLDSETRDNLTKSHSASKSLVYVINDLLDLTKAEDGNNLVKEEPFDLNATLREATDPFVGDAKRKDIEYRVQFSSDMPHTVVGDHRRVRQIVSNLVANAVQHTAVGSVMVEAWKSHAQPDEPRVEIELSVEDTGAGMSQSKVDALFRELEEVSFESEDSASKLLDQDPFMKKDDGSAKAALGLGLAVVARTIRNMGGQLRLKTEEGKGSRFIIQLGFDLDRTSETTKQELEFKPPPLVQGVNDTSQTKQVGTPTIEGEVMLVDRSAQKMSDSALLIRKRSGDSMNSVFSNKSRNSMQSGKSNTSVKSDVDRLIDAIQEPLRRTSRSQSLGADGSPTHQTGKSIRSYKSALANVPGQEKVTDSGVPIRPLRMPEEGMENKTGRGRNKMRVAFDDAESSDPSPSTDAPLSSEHFSVLVAEDDPINSRIMKKRLETLGHTVCLTVNGEQCSSMHGEHAHGYDAILMDLQMPIVDGFTSTKMIRSFEKTQSKNFLSRRAALNGRIPIFAVSASLVEREKEKYIETGFDGWILKPVDFKRTNLLLKGIVDEDARAACIYQPGHSNWEHGGWFEKRKPRASFGAQDVDTRPSGKSPVRGSRETIESIGGNDELIAEIQGPGEDYGSYGEGSMVRRKASETGSGLGSTTGSTTPTPSLDNVKAH